MTQTAPTLPADGSSPAREMWLTTVLRPAGSMTAADAQRFSAALQAASASSGVVLVDLRAAGPLPRDVRRALADADTRLARSGGALLVVDADTDDREVPAQRSAAHLLESGT